jgi:hypothetical protein
VGDLETAIFVKANIEEYAIWIALPDSPNGLQFRGGGVDRDPFSLEEQPRCLDESRIVVDKETSQRHVMSVAQETRVRNYC